MGAVETVPDFDENWYRAAYPDIEAAIANGHFQSGQHHYSRFGRDEGRLPFKFDPDFYVFAYPLAATEVRSGLADSPLDHYLTLGRSRGYLPHKRAVRPANAHAPSSPFGGLWTDAPNALDLVQGKIELGNISEAEAEQILFWIDNGYMILPGAVSEEVALRAERALDLAYSGKMSELLFECHRVSRDIIPWRAEMNACPAKALDIHMFSEAIRETVFASPITRMLGILFDCLPLASQTLGFLRGSAQPAHQDSAYVAYTLPRQFAATWIALEDAAPNAGELFYYPGSHKFQEYVYGDGLKSVSEAKRLGAKQEDLSARVSEHEASLPERARQYGIERQTFLPKRGDVLIWHSDLAHGGAPVSQEVTRKSVVTHYCPRFNVPLFFEGGSTRHFYRHGDGYFASGVYPFAEPK